MLYPGEPIIGDHTPATAPVVTGGMKGYIPRDYTLYPKSMFSPPSGIPLIPRSEWPQRIADRIREKAQLSDIRMSAGPGGGPVPSLDQGPIGYCWAHSTAHAVMLDRMVRLLPYIPLSAYSVAATIKTGRDEGGWCGLSAQFMVQYGIAEQSVWPQGNRDHRLFARDDVKASMANHKITGDWVDLAAAVYDRNLSFDMDITLLLSNIPGPRDYNHWGHSVCGLDPVDGETQRTVTRGDNGKLLQLTEFDLVWGMNDPVTGGIGIRIWNSWADSWGATGMGVLTGQKAISDGALGIRHTTA